VAIKLETQAQRGCDRLGLDASSYQLVGKEEALCVGPGVPKSAQSAER
jgi:hypothetical protein